MPETGGELGGVMRKTMQAIALMAIGITALLGALALPASGQAASNGCPPGQPPGRPPGVPPGNPPGQSNRPQYPPGRCQLALSQAAGQRGDSVQATGGGFVPGEAVTFSVAGQRAAIDNAEPKGVVSAVVVVPQNVPDGRIEVLAVGQDQTLSAGFEVLPSQAPSTSRGNVRASLPVTGVQIAGLMSFGLLLVAIGAVAVVSARRDRMFSGG